MSVSIVTQSDESITLPRLWPFKDYWQADLSVN